MASSQLLAEGPLLPRGTKAVNIDPEFASSAAGDGEELFPETSSKKRVQVDKDEAGLFGKTNQASKLLKKRQDMSKAAVAKKLKLDEEQDKEQRRSPSRLTLSKVTVGMKLFGCVVKVTKEKVVVQLCNQLTCVVAVAEVSDEHHDAVERNRELPSQLKDAVSLHQYVPVVILALDGFLRASMRASLLNKQQLVQVPPTQRVMLFCSIKSVEDHGAIVNLGLKHLQGFLRFGKDAAQSFVVGQTGIEVSFVPQQAINGVVTVQLAHRANDEVPAPVPSFASLFPGMNVMVSDVVRDDLLDGGSLLTLPIHQAKVHAVTDWCHRNEHDQETGQAMVLWVDYLAKTVGLSFLPHLVFRHRTSHAFVPSPAYKVGDLVRAAQVQRVQARFGVVLVKDSVQFFAPVGKLVDLGKKHKTEAFPAPTVVRDQFGVDSVHDLRVLEVNLIEGALLCSLQDSAVRTGGDSIDLTPGSVVSGRIVKVDPKLGLFLQVAHSCVGLVTLMHVGDSTTSTIDLSKRFRVDQEVKALVLSHSEDKTHFSLKKSLLDSALPMVTEYSADMVGRVTLGTVVKVDDRFGLLVSFLNRVQGIVPLHDLGEKVAKDMHDLYRVGQVVKVKVIQVQPEAGKMRLSVKTSSAPLAAHNSMATDEEDPTLVVGGGTVVHKADDSLMVEFTRNGVLLRGALHKMHLADYPDQCDAAFARLQRGSKLKMLLVLNSSRQPFTLSLKPELVAQARLDALPSKLEQLVVGEVYSGAVSNNQDFGSFVHFAAGLTGFVPKANLYDSMAQVGHHPALLSQHATVRAMITAVDRETNRITCSLKPSVVGGFAHYLANKLGHLAELNAMRNSNAPMACTVTHRVDKVGVSLSVADSAFTGFCALEHCPGGRLPEVGAKLSLTRVLAVDFETKVMDLSARPELHAAVWRTATEDGDRSLDIEVELWKPEYCVVSYYCGKSGQDRVLALYSLVSFNQSASTSIPIRFGTRMRACGPGGLAVLEPWSQRAAVVTAKQRLRSDSLADFPVVPVKLNATVPVKIRELRGCWAKVDVRVDAATVKQALLHSCDVLDHPKTVSLAAVADGAFGDLSVGQVVQAKVVEIAPNQTLHLSLRPSVLSSKQDHDEVLSWDDNRLPERNQVYDAWVDEVVTDGVLVALSRHMRGLCFATQVTSDLDVLDELFNGNDDKVHQVFPVGRPVRVRVLEVDPSKKLLGLSMVWN